MGVFVVTVTYGNRYHLIEKVLLRLLEMNIARIIIIDNFSEPESKEKLANFTNRHPTKILLKSLEKNFGSAGGFKRGIELAEQSGDCEFIWLLDDDNLPEQNALKELLSSYEKIPDVGCLVALRKSRVPYRKIHNLKDVKRKFHPYNSFMNFNILHGFTKKFQYSLRKERRELIPIPYGPYGGLFFNKSLLKVIGYPKEEMFLYMDDHEFSHRVIKNDLKIYLNRRSIIEDIEVSWHGTKKYRLFKSFRLTIDGDEWKTYYIIRNLIYFEKKYYVANKFKYALNKFLYKAVFYSLCYVLNKTDRIKLFQRAYHDSKFL